MTRIKFSTALSTLTFLVALMTGSSMALAQSSTRSPDEQQQSASDSELTIELNSATETELLSLPGIGPSKVAAIVAHRERRPFQRIEQIMLVRGIGRATFRNLRSQIRVDAQPRSERRRRRSRR